MSVILLNFKNSKWLQVVTSVVRSGKFYKLLPDKENTDNDKKLFLYYLSEVVSEEKQT